MESQAETDDRPESSKSRLLDKSSRECQEYDPIGNACGSCLAHCCRKSTIFAPVAFIACLVVWSYFSYVVCFCFFILSSADVAMRIVFLIVYHVLLVMFLWAYLTTIFSLPKPIPPEYSLTADQIAQLSKGKQHVRQMFDNMARERNLACKMRTVDALIRYCEVCKALKPDRTHHCTVCRRCVPKMDHHCPWVANCVGFHNYKQFILMLIYTSAWSAFQWASMLPSILQFFTGDGFVSSFAQYCIIVTFFIAVIFFAAVTSLLFYHIYLIINNRTTLEANRAPVFLQRNAAQSPQGQGQRNNSTEEDVNAYNNSMFENLVDLCGSRCYCWFVPIPTSVGDGFSFRRRGRIDSVNVEAGLSSSLAQAPQGSAQYGSLSKLPKNADEAKQT